MRARIVHQKIKTIIPSANNISAMRIHMVKYPKQLILGLISAAFISACSTTQTSTSSECSCNPTEQADNKQKAPQPALVKGNFDELPGWNTASHDKLLSTFVSQCSEQGNALGKLKSTPPELLEFCRKTRREVTANPSLPAQFWMESELDVWQLQNEDGSKEGLLTGYFEPLLKGSRNAKGAFQYPLYAEPADLISVDLASLDPDLKGKRLRGRLQGNKLVPFFDRATWERIGPSREDPIVWVDDELDAFLLQVQGSGRVLLNDGSVIRLGYANQNGHPYKSIGGVLVRWGELTVEQATIPGIRQWAKKNPKRLKELLNQNPSMVFFKENKVLNPNEGPVGALGIPLTEELSIAIDRTKIPYGSLMWLQSSNPATQENINHGVLAQDTGGAIRGRVRADYFWGTGHKAGELAGITRQPLQLWLLWPKNAELPDIK